jgi:hypothetical protein
MPDAIDSVSDKVISIFAEIVGERANRLRGDRIAVHAMDAIEEALSSADSADTAREIAFHLSDWNWDAAFIVCLHLYPERFTAEEIEAGIGLFLVHAPNHIRAACGLTGTYVWENWPESDPPDWERPGRSDV